MGWLVTVWADGPYAEEALEQIRAIEQRPGLKLRGRGYGWSAVGRRTGSEPARLPDGWHADIAVDAPRSRAEGIASAAFREALEAARIPVGEVQARLVGDADRSDATPETVADWTVHTDVALKASQAEAAILDEALRADSRVAHRSADAVYSSERQILSVLFHLECARAHVEQTASAIIEDAVAGTTIDPAAVTRELVILDEWRRCA